MEEKCCVCGEPHYLFVDARSFCAHHAWVVTREIERTIDHLKFHQWSSYVERFTTIGEYTKTKT